MTATVQWEAVAGVTHAWIAQCGGYVSLCGREVSGFGGQRSGIRCGLCAIRTGWADATGESSYWTPQGPMIVERRQPRPRQRRPLVTPWNTPPPPLMAPVAREAPPPIEWTDVIPDGPASPVLVAPALRVPESLGAYEGLPVAEQRYWAPLMLARAGQEAIWDQAKESAEDFQQRCYEQLQAGEDQG